ncbi:MAG TPA: BatA and WFA domain-containing protein, partial [Candidatus Kapabacteria bacterium]|nr:BatA and WFA domain-containing protein [Candidatus Kapabacteria bacterium]
MFPTFTNLALLGGLAAITAPILIHLLLRRKSQRMRFSTVQFFLKQDEQSMRKRKLRNLLLLATRVLLFTLIALAFARPFLPGGAIPPDEGDRRELVILLDTSASMQAASPGGVQWTRAVEAARKELGKLKMNDRAVLITCSTRAELISEFAPASVVQTKLEAIKPSFGKAQLDEGLRQATKVLATANPNSKVEICIISDLQSSGVENVSSTPLPRDVAVRTVDLGERFIPNVAVTSLH